MKKLFFMAILIALTQVSYSQKPLDQDVWIDVGESETVQLLDFNASNFFSGASGADVNWNFSNLPTGTDVCMYEGLPMSMSPFRDRFPNADMFYLCEIGVGTGETAEVHTFYSKQGNIVSFEGTATVSVNVSEFDSIFLQYDDPQTFLQFPFNYQDSYSDDYTGTLTTYAQQEFVVNIEGTVTSTAESYGTLTTPAGVFDDCLRIRRTELESVMIAGIPVSTQQEAHRYTWASSDENYLLLNLDSLVTKDFTGATVATSYAGLYRTDGPSTSSFEINDKLKEIKVYPNPITDFVNIEYPSRSGTDIKMVISDMQGSRHSVYNFEKNNRLQIDMSQYSKGTYILHWIDSDGTKIAIPLFKM